MNGQQQGDGTSEVVVYRNKRNKVIRDEVGNRLAPGDIVARGAGVTGAAPVIMQVVERGRNKNGRMLLGLAGIPDTPGDEGTVTQLDSDLTTGGAVVLSLDGVAAGSVDGRGNRDREDRFTGGLDSGFGWGAEPGEVVLYGSDEDFTTRLGVVVKNPWGYGVLGDDMLPVIPVAVMSQDGVLVAHQGGPDVVKIPKSLCIRVILKIPGAEELEDPTPVKKTPPEPGVQKPRRRGRRIGARASRTADRPLS